MPAIQQESYDLNKHNAVRAIFFSYKTWLAVFVADLFLSFATGAAAYASD